MESIFTVFLLIHKITCTIYSIMPSVMFYLTTGMIFFKVSLQLLIIHDTRFHECLTDGADCLTIVSIHFHLFRFRF